MALSLDQFLNGLQSVESSGNPTNTNPDSGAYGLFQILPSNWNEWASEAGVDPKDQSAAAQRKVAGFKAQQYHDQFGSWDAAAVAWYAGPAAAQRYVANPNDPSFTSPQGKYPSIADYTKNVMSAAGGGTSAGSTTQATGTQAGQKTRLPSDAKIYQTSGGAFFAVFDQGGVLLRFAINPSQVDISGLQAQRISDEQFGAMNTVNAPGGAAELDSVARDYGSFDAYFAHVLQQLLPAHSSAIMDASVRGVIAQIAANPALLDSPTAIQQLLSHTDWYQNKTDQARKYNESSLAQQQQMVGDAAVRLADSFTNRTGKTITLNDPRLQQWAQDVASGKRGEGQILYEEIIPLAQSDPQSPWSRERQQENLDEHKQGNAISDRASQTTDLFRRWGVPVTADLANQWANDLVLGNKSEGDLQSYLEGQSKILYPWKDPSTPTLDAAQPWLSTYQRVLEQSPNGGIQDPLVQKALNNGTPLWQFEQQLKQDPRWLATKNANDDITQGMATAGKIMGFT